MNGTGVSSNESMEARQISKEAVAIKEDLYNIVVMTIQGKKEAFSDVQKIVPRLIKGEDIFVAASSAAMPVNEEYLASHLNEKLQNGISSYEKQRDGYTLNIAGVGASSLLGGLLFGVVGNILSHDTSLSLLYGLGTTSLLALVGFASLAWNYRNLIGRINDYKTALPLSQSPQNYKIRKIDNDDVIFKLYNRLSKK